MLPALVPELTVCDFARSLTFYTEVLGWQVIYDRPEEGFAMLGLGEARLMIDALAEGRNFDQTLRAEHRPFGRGMNLEIEVPRLAPLLEGIEAAGLPLHLEPEEAWYRTGDQLSGQRQFIIADPDGYLLRFVESLGTRAGDPSDAL